MNQSCFRQIDSSAVCTRAYTRGPARTHADLRLPSCTCLYPSVVSSSDSLMSASHQADVRLAPGCVTYPILVQQGYMAVQPVIWRFSKVIWRFSRVIWQFSKVICWIVCVVVGWWVAGLAVIINLNRVRLSCFWVGLWQFKDALTHQANEGVWIYSRPKWESLNRIQPSHYCTSGCGMKNITSSNLDCENIYKISEI